MGAARSKHGGVIGGDEDVIIDNPCSSSAEQIMGEGGGDGSVLAAAA